MSTPVGQWQPGMTMTAGRLQYMLEGATWTSVIAFGAVGDGVNNDAPAIQAALDGARDAGGGWVVVPPGDYLLSTLPLRIYKNTQLTLGLGARFIRNAASTLLINGDANQNLGGYSGQGHIIIEGGVWEMRGTTTGLTGSTMCISIGHAQDITVRDIEVRDVPGYHAVELNSTKRGVISNCQFRGYVDPDGTRNFSEAVQLDLAKSSAEFGGFGPYDHTPCEDILIDGCFFGASGTAGTTAWPRGVGSHAATITKYHRRIRVVGCSFEGVLQYGVSAYNWEDTTVTGNTFTGCGSGVRLRSVIVTDTEDTKLPDGTQTSASQLMRNLTITGNSFRAGGSYDEPIVALGESTGQVLNLTIGDNAIDGSGGAENGIRLQRVERVTVVGNTVANSGGSGISTEECQNGLVANNQIHQAGSHGITMVTNTDFQTTGNVIMYPQGSGILVQGGTSLHVKQNYVRAPSRATNGGAYAIRVSTNTNGIHVQGNRCRPNGSGNEASNGFSASTTVVNLARSGNDFRGAWTGAAIDDQSGSGAGGVTTATDLS